MTLKGVGDLILTFGVSGVSAWVFLAVRCRPKGRLFGSKSWWAAILVIGVTAAASTAIGAAVPGVLGVLGTTAGHHLPPAAVGLAAPSALWLTPQLKQRARNRQGSSAQIASLWFTTLLEILDERIRQDKHEWCVARSSVKIQDFTEDQLKEMADHFYEQVRDSLPDPDRRRGELRRLHDGVLDRAEAINAFGSQARPDKVRKVLDKYEVTRDKLEYAADADNPERLKRRLRHDANEDLYRILSKAYDWRCYGLDSFTPAAAGE